jgi:hypothetical protein
MGGKGKKKSKNKKQAAEAVDEEAGENGEGNGSAKKGKGKGKKGKAGKSSKFQGDILSEAAMENAYYICHNLMDVLKVNTRREEAHYPRVDWSTFYPISGSWLRLAGIAEEEEEGEEVKLQLFHAISVPHHCNSTTIYTFWVANVLSSYLAANELAPIPPQESV